jgi:hypothetical protein
MLDPVLGLQLNDLELVASVKRRYRCAQRARARSRTDAAAIFATGSLSSSRQPSRPQAHITSTEPLSSVTLEKTRSSSCAALMIRRFSIPVAY